ncbi:uncharacterized protein LOC134210679 [Armigeres subalbatus]|uniref:uncharacterized protein LOC134210679 n=1 Tax=Armigeres subalbatus TaxID=124917 RepID=UPI002ED2409A
MIRFRIYFLILLIVFHFSSAICGPTAQTPAVSHSSRVKRQFSMNFGATHQQDEGTDVTAEAIARLWRSRSGNTEVQGTASYNQHFGGYNGDGHDYRLKLKVVFT